MQVVQILEFKLEFQYINLKTMIRRTANVKITMCPRKEEIVRYY